MRAISLILSLVMIGTGIYGLTISGSSTDQGYWIGALIVGIIWLLADIVAIKKHQSEKSNK